MPAQFKCIPCAHLSAAAPAAAPASPALPACHALHSKQERLVNLSLHRRAPKMRLQRCAWRCICAMLQLCWTGSRAHLSEAWVPGSQLVQHGRHLLACSRQVLNQVACGWWEQKAEHGLGVHRRS